MRINEQTQSKTVVYRKILDVLEFVKRTTGESQTQIARRLGYQHNYFSKVLSGDSQGSPQLLSGLELLAEVNKLRQENARLEETLRLERREVDRLQGKPETVPAKFPEAKPTFYKFNEKPAKRRSPRPADPLLHIVKHTAHIAPDQK